MEQKTTEHHCRDKRGRFTECKDDHNLRKPKMPKKGKRAYWSVMSSFLLLSTAVAMILFSMTANRGNKALARVENEYNEKITSLTQQLKQQQTPEQKETDEKKIDPPKPVDPVEIHDEN